MTRTKSRQRAIERRKRRRQWEETPAGLRARGHQVATELRADGGPVELVAADGGEDGQAALPRFKMTAYTGGKMRPQGFYRDVVVDLSGLKIAGGARPILLNHDSNQPVGHSEAGEIKNTGRQITAEGTISAASPDSERVTRSSGNGFPWRSSIGASIEKIVFLDDGETTQVNGRRVVGPAYIVRAGTLREISFVTLAGDDRSSATVTATREGALPMTFEQWLAARGLDQQDLSADAMDALRAAYDAEQDLQAGGDQDQDPPGDEPGRSRPHRPQRQLQAGADEGDDPVDQLAAASAAELDRQHRIAELCAAADHVPENRRLEIRAQATRERWDTTKTELELLRASRAGAGSLNIQSRQSVTGQPTPGTLVAALCYAANSIPEAIIARGLPQQDVDRATSGAYRNLDLHCLMEQVILTATGQHYTGPRRSNDFIRATMRAERALHARHELDFSSLEAASGFTTISLSGILGNVANKQLLASFEAVETVHQYLTQPVSHSDFKVHTRYRLDATGGFKKVGADGELKHGGLEESPYTAQLDTYGMIIALTRRHMYNDDLGAFLQIPTLIGRLSALAMEEAFFVLLLANTGSFFGTGNKNYFEGADSALSIDAISTGRQKFVDQVDVNSKPIGVFPRILLVGSNQQTLAEELFSEDRVDVTTTANKRAFASNPHRGLYKPYVSPYVNNTGIKATGGEAISGQTSTGWWMFADPMTRAAFVCATLNGRRAPIIESDDTEFSTLGMQWRGYHDFGMGQNEHEAAVHSKGTS